MAANVDTPAAAGRRSSKKGGPHANQGTTTTPANPTTANDRETPPLRPMPTDAGFTGPQHDGQHGDTLAAVKLCTQLWPQNSSWEALRDAAVVADSVGFEMVSTWDHFYALQGEPEKPNLESTTVLAALGPVTKRVKLTALVQSVTYRHPALIANIAATHDNVSNGRAVCGIGAGWNQIELGSVGERMRRFNEAARIVRGLLDGERVTYKGKYYELKNAMLNTRPLQKRLPIMIGGGGEQKTLRTTAKYADLWHTFGAPEI